MRHITRTALHQVRIGDWSVDALALACNAVAMCGRYVAPGIDEIDSEFDSSFDGGTLHVLASQPVAQSRNFNVAPTHGVPVVRVVRNRQGKRQSSMMRWGLVPHWMHGEARNGATINATIERLETAPMWRDPWARGQRCVLPALGFYEWHVNDDGSKSPFFVRPSDGGLFHFAGLWERSITRDSREIFSCAVITMPANALMASIHNVKKRMPAIVQGANVETWLAGTPSEARAVLTEYPSDQMVAWPVATKVNSPNNNAPDLVQPIDAPPREVLHR